MKVDTDENLVSAACRGDSSAQAKLVQKHYKSVFLVCLGMVSNVHDAEDLAQEAMLKGMTELEKLRQPDKLAHWLYRIARNTCVNQLRHKKQNRAMLAEKITDQLQNEHLPSRNRQQDHHQEHLQDAITQLPLETRLPLVMFYLDGKNVNNVARDLDISPSGVYQKLRSGLKQLHELLVDPSISK